MRPQNIVALVKQFISLPCKSPEVSHPGWLTALLHTVIRGPGFLHFIGPPTLGCCPQLHDSYILGHRYLHSHFFREKVVTWPHLLLQRAKHIPAYHCY